MTKYEQNKKYAAKWDKENRASIGCKVRKETREQFKAWAEARGLTVSGAVAAYVRQCIAESPDAPDAPDEPAT